MEERAEQEDAQSLAALPRARRPDGLSARQQPPELGFRRRQQQRAGHQATGCRQPQQYREGPRAARGRDAARRQPVHDQPAGDQAHARGQIDEPVAEAEPAPARLGRHHVAVPRSPGRARALARHLVEADALR